MASDLPTTSAETESPVNRRNVVVLIGGMCNISVVYGLMLSINTLYVELLDVFQTTRKETSFIQTTFIGISFASGFVTGIIVNRVGIKISLLTGTVMSSTGFFLSWFATSVPYLIATLGVLAGFGNSLVNISTIVLITSTFKEKRSLPLALLMVGSGLGQILFPLLIERMLDIYGWRGSLLITSGLYLNLAISCLLTTSSLGAGIKFSLPKNKEKKDNGLRSLQNIISPTYLIYVSSSGLCLASVVNIVVLFMDFLVTQGQTLETSVNIYAGYSVIGLLARLGVGVLTLCKNANSFVIFWFFGILPGCSLLFLKVSSSLTSTVVLLYLTSIGMGGMTSLMNIVRIDLAGVDNAAIASGIGSMFTGILTPVMGFLIGWIFDTTRSYSLAFDVCGYVITGSALINFMMFGVQVYLKKRRTFKPQQKCDI